MMSELNEGDLWRSVELQLRENVQRIEGDRDWQDTLNRVVTQLLGKAGIKPPPRLGPGACTIALEWVPRSQLEATLRIHGRAQPASAERKHPPPILVRYSGLLIVVDGHLRINGLVERAGEFSTAAIVMAPH